LTRATPQKKTTHMTGRLFPVLQTLRERVPCLKWGAFYFSILYSAAFLWGHWPIQQVSRSPKAPPACGSSSASPQAFTLAPPSQVLSEKQFPLKTAFAPLPATSGPLGAPSLLTLVVRSGDTFQSLLTQSGFVTEQAREACEALKKHIDLRRLGVGQEIKIKRAYRAGVWCLESLSFSPEMGVEIALKPVGKGKFSAERKTYRLHNQQVAVEGTIQESFYVDALRQGVNPQVLQKIVRVLAHRFDLQRDFQPGDSFKILYKCTWDPRRGATKADTFLYTAVVVGGKSHSFYQFKPSGSQSYAVFDDKGRNLAREFLRTPMDDGARLSSTFGMRLHPILGYTKFHPGVDFAAPSGTRVFAAGNGVVVRATWYGAYGNYVLIRHNKDYQTAYAHLKSFGPGIRPGTVVKQGQVIGYVGTTGRSTGPHLHFELHKGGKQINPKSLKQLPSQVLKGADLKAFRTYTQKMTQAYIVQMDKKQNT